MGGGVAIYTKNCLNAEVVESYTSQKLSAIWVKVAISTTSNIIYVCVYHPPDASDNATLEYLTAAAAKVNELHKNCPLVITGDFNRLNIESITLQLGLESKVNFPTRELVKLDDILTDVEDYEPAEKVSPLSRNDHCCILLKKKTKPATGKYIYIHQRKTTKHCKTMLLSELAQTDWTSLLVAKNVDTKVEILYSIINKLLDKHCPIQKKKVRKDKPEWINDTIIKSIRARERAYGKNCSSWKVLRTITQRMIRKSKRRFVANKVNNNSDAKTWWKYIKKLTNKVKKSTITSNTTHLNGNNIGPTELCNQLNDYFASVGGEPVDAPLGTRSGNNTQCQSLESVSIGYVKLLLKRIDVTKATSTEDYPSWISKEGCEDLCIPIHDIVNSILLHKTYPTMWKRAEITPVPKVTHPKQLTDYRPISLLHHIGKLAEQVVIDKMSKCISANISHNQYAYRKGLSTTDALVAAIDDWTAGLDYAATECIQTVMLDFSKAFDRLQPAILAQKLDKAGLNSNIISIISSFLSNRYQCVSTSGCKSSFLPINVGTPQGTKLGPILWLFYIND